MSIGVLQAAPNLPLQPLVATSGPSIGAPSIAPLAVVGPSTTTDIIVALIMVAQVMQNQQFIQQEHMRVPQEQLNV